MDLGLKAGGPWSPAPPRVSAGRSPRPSPRRLGRRRPRHRRERARGAHRDDHRGRADLSTAAGCANGAAAGLEALGGLDILVNNVGSGAVRSFDELSDADWQRTFDLNFMSYVRMIRACLPHLREADHGSIINNASDLGRQPEAVPMDYSASKAAVLALTKGLARAEGPGLRVNAVAPGPGLDPVLDEAGRLRRHLRHAPQDGADGGGRARNDPSSAAPPAAGNS